MNNNDPSMTITRLCQAVGVSRQAYYQACRRARRQTNTDRQVLRWIRDERSDHPRMGGRKLYHQLKPKIASEGLTMGRDKLFELLRRNDMLVPPRTSRAPRTTRGAWTHWTNKLREATINGPNQAFVADITYLRTLDGFCYLALISDKYSRKVIGWDVADTLEMEGAHRALTQALGGIDPATTPIHHSDRGSQYRSKRYIQTLREAGCTISMTEDDHCAENAQAERVNGILKNEYLLDQMFLSVDQARQASRQAIDLYNSSRPHLSLNYQTPDQVHRAA